MSISGGCQVRPSASWPPESQNAGHIPLPFSNSGYASGDLVLYLDANDLLYPSALERVENVFHAQLAKAQFELDVIDQDGWHLGRRYRGFSSPITENDLAANFRRCATYMWPVTSGNVYARKFLEKIMPLTPPVSHDGALNTIAPLYGGRATIIEPLGQYRVHHRNISRVDSLGAINIVPDFASHPHPQTGV
jgi:hypothetical protein